MVVFVLTTIFIGNYLKERPILILLFMFITNHKTIITLLTGCNQYSKMLYKE